MNYDTEIWRPNDTAGPVCLYIYKDDLCTKKGAHHCNPRAQRFIDFCAKYLSHTKGPLARQPFVLEQWQIDELIHPIFGEVIWSDDWQQYGRRFEVAAIVISRKNGKSAIASAIVMYLLLGDFEESADVFGAAKDRDQAEMVYDPARRMKDLNETLRTRIKENKARKSLTDEATNSKYQIIASDPEGNLGFNPHGFVLDEVVSQPNRDLWDSLRTASGARVQALFFAITTEVNDDSSFGAKFIDEAEEIQANPSMQPRTFAWVRKTPEDVDPWDENNWYHANPALGTFKSITSIRTQAQEAQNNPENENAFRQFQLNQRVQQVTRWMPMHRWDVCDGDYTEEELEGKECFGGLDLASTTDLAALAWLFPPDGDCEIYRILWRFWAPEESIRNLDEYTAGRASSWVRDGFLTATEGDWIDYFGDEETGISYNDIIGAPDKLAIHPQIKQDSERFKIRSIGYDQAQATATAQYMMSLNINIDKITQGYSLSPGLKETLRRIKSQVLFHGGNPVARWCYDSADVKRDTEDRIKIIKPDRAASRKRVDGVVALGNAIQTELKYEGDDELDILGSVF